MPRHSVDGGRAVRLPGRLDERPERVQLHVQAYDVVAGDGPADVPRVAPGLGPGGLHQSIDDMLSHVQKDQLGADQRRRARGV